MEICFNNKFYRIYKMEFENNSISYKIECKSRSLNSQDKSIVLDKSYETIWDYLECTRVFSFSKRYGKIARRWFNRELRPILVSLGFTYIDDLYSGKLNKKFLNKLDTLNHTINENPYEFKSLEEEL